jgi:hypothetical protein
MDETVPPKVVTIALVACFFALPALVVVGAVDRFRRWRAR